MKTQKLTSDTDYEIEGLIPGRKYTAYVWYAAGAGTITPKHKRDNATTTSGMFQSDGTTALTITATTEKGFTFTAVSSTIVLTVSSASTLEAYAEVREIQHGWA